MGLLDNDIGLSKNSFAVGVGAVALGAAAGLGTAAIIGANKRRKSKRRKTRNTRKRNSRSKKKRGRYSPHTAGKGKDRSHKRIRYTKNGQPYIIMASGKARFISKRGAKLSHKRKGGRY